MTAAGPRLPFESLKLRLGELHITSSKGLVKSKWTIRVDFALPFGNINLPRLLAGAAASQH
jgi:hypothetical protein